MSSPCCYSLFLKGFSKGKCLSRKVPYLWCSSLHMWLSLCIVQVSPFLATATLSELGENEDFTVKWRIKNLKSRKKHTGWRWILNLLTTPASDWLIQCVRAFRDFFKRVTGHTKFIVWSTCRKKGKCLNHGHPGKHHNWGTLQLASSRLLCNRPLTTQTPHSMKRGGGGNLLTTADDSSRSPGLLDTQSSPSKLAVDANLRRWDEKKHMWQLCFTWKTPVEPTSERNPLHEKTF